MKRVIFILIVTLSLSLFGIGGTPAADVYKFSKEIPIGGEGGWDYLSVDAQSRRLYVTHSTKVVVVDLEQDKVIGEISDTRGVHGVALAPELGRAFTSNGQEAKASIVDLKTLKTLSKVQTGEKPDAILYEPGAKAVYAFNGRSNSATIFEAETGKVIATIPLPGKPEFAACDPVAGLVYCNIEDKDVVVVIDAKKHEVVNTWPLAPGKEPTGMAIDLANHRLFVGCHSKQVVMMDSTNGKIVATAPIGAGVDATFFDTQSHLVFNSNGEGTVSIAKEDGDALTPIQTLATKPGARTMALDPKTHAIYVPAVEYAPASKDQPEAANKRPQPIPGSMKLLVYTLDKSVPKGFPAECHLSP